MAATISRAQHSAEGISKHRPELFRKLVQYAKRERVTIHEDDWDFLVARGLVNDDGSMDDNVRRFLLPSS